MFNNKKVEGFMKRFVIFFLFCVSLFSVFSFADSETTNSSEELPENICSPTECYKVIKVLGEGAFGKVYAVENSSAMPFAIKSYKKEFEEPGLLGDAEREFERGQLLNHQNIVKSFDLFDTESSDKVTTNLVLDFIEGNTIYKTKKGSLSQSDTLKTMIQLIDALRYAHSMGLMHLDLHSNNVMIDKNVDLMVIDLASFFSFEELFTFVYNEAKEKAEKQKASTQKKLEPYAKAMQMEISEKPPEAVLPPKRAEKLKAFFQQYPEIFEEIQQRQSQQENPAPQYAKTLKMVSKKTSTNEKTPESSPPKESDKSPFQSYYLNSITEMCIYLISKSDLNRQDKINIRAEIKKIAWNSEEDLDEGKKVEFDAYLDELINTLQTPLTTLTK